MTAAPVDTHHHVLSLGFMRLTGLPELEDDTTLCELVDIQCFEYTLQSPGAQTAKCTRQLQDDWCTCAICIRPDGSKPSYATGFGFFSNRLRSSSSCMHSAPMLRQSWYFSSSVNLHNGRDDVRWGQCTPNSAS